MNKVDGKLKNYQSRSASLAIKIQIDQFFIAHLLTLVKNQELRIDAKHLVVHPSIQYDHQQWYQWPRHLERHVSGLITRFTEWLQCRWQKMLIENWRISKAVWPPSIWQKVTKWPVYWCSPLTFALNVFLFYLESIKWIFLLCDIGMIKITAIK